MINEREVVLDSLLEILENGEYSHIVEKAVLDKHDYLKQNEKAFIKRVTEGTIENLLAIDEIINRYAKTKTNKQKKIIRNILRMSVYQILYMDKVPSAAVCNEAVKLAGKRGFRTLGGFVNGVLRNIVRDKAKLEKEKISTMPDWIVEHFEKEFGKEKAEIIIEAFDKPSPVTIRGRRKLKESALYTPVPLEDNVYTLTPGASLREIEGYEDGAFVVQDIDSMSVCKMAEIKEGMLVIDVCASPGGKSIQAYDLGARVISCDISDYKVNNIRSNLERCQIEESSLEKVLGKEGSFVALVQDATIYNSLFEEKADIVIADVPCSGLGVLGKKSDIRFKTSSEDLLSLPKIQRTIIDNVYHYVKKGGILMYSTCTLNSKENEEQVKYITENLPFELWDEKLFVPGIDKGDGFYVAKLVRK